MASPDTDLLHDATGMFKHFVLTRPSATISGAAAIVSKGYGEMRYGAEVLRHGAVAPARRNNYFCCRSGIMASTPG